jgi:ABC-type glutathione transport system ATPase component
MTAHNDSALIRVSNLSKDYVQKRPLTRSKVTVRALLQVNLTIRQGATLAIVGESGSGKSTLVRCLSLIEWPTNGEIWWLGVNLVGLGKQDLFEMRRRVQMVFQDSTSALNPGMRAAEIIEEPLAIQGIGTQRERRQHALALMEEVRLSARRAGKLPMELSGGQRQRLAIARALALGPELLIFDEALSNLDLANQDAILRLLRELQAARGLTYVHVAHDLRMVEDLADEVAVMHEGEIVEHKSAEEIFLRPEHSYTRELLAASPLLESIVEERRVAECV